MAQRIRSLLALQANTNRRTKSDALRVWAAFFLKRQCDFAYIATPCRFPARSLVLYSWLASMESEFNRGSPVDYHYPLQALEVSVKEWGLTTAIADVDETSPVSRFLKA